MLDEISVDRLKTIILDQFREEYPNDAELLLFEAYIHFQSNDYENVKRLLQIGLKNKKNPYKSLFANNLAVIYMLEGNLVGAKKLLKSHSKLEHIDEDLSPEFQKAFSHWITISFNGRYEPPISMFLPGVFEAGMASMVNLVSLNPGEDEINETTSFVFSMLTALLDSDKDKSSIQLLRFFCYLLIGYIELTKGQLRKAYDSLNYSSEFAEKNSILDEEGVLTLRSWVENMNQSNPSE